MVAAGSVRLLNCCGVRGRSRRTMASLWFDDDDDDDGVGCGDDGGVGCGDDGGFGN